MRSDLKKAIEEAIGEDGVEALNEISRVSSAAAGLRHSPVSAVQWVPIDDVIANDYNPNQVAKNELKLLALSIDHDGYTQPVVAVYDADHKKYVIVDGFHRYLTMKTNRTIRERYHDLLPVVVLNKSVNERMAATVRHNRARGKHTINGMGYLVAQLRDKGWNDAEVCNEIGLEPDELVRLEHMTGVAELFKDREYNKSWETVKQTKLKREINDGK